MTKNNSIPRNSFARIMIRLNGWGREEAIREIVGIDHVDFIEAERRYETAQKQLIDRAIGQARRQDKIKSAIKNARNRALAITYHYGQFVCSKDLPTISNIADWGYSVGFNSTGRAMREIVAPLEKEGSLSELYDEDGKFIGYTLTDTGRKEFLDE